MVSSRPSPAPTRGRVPYPSADSYIPGDVGFTPALNAEGGLAPPSAASDALASSPTSSAPSPAPPTPATEDSEPMKEGGMTGGLRRLASRRRSTRDKEKGKDKAQEHEAPEPSSKEAPMERKPSREMTEREQSSLNLKNWWKSFTQRDTAPPPERSFRRAPQTMNTRHVFGVSLSRVLTYAAMQISTSAPDGSLYVWGEVPIIVGRCGAYLKTKTDIEGVFRVSGSAKRMRDLQVRFDEGPKYGIDLEWDQSPYTPHDVATILRRYLTQMSEPVIPFQSYNAFRAVQVSDHPPEQKVREYKRLVREMPRENQYLLLYLLDLLGIFARESDKNLMTSPNLAVIFQPGILSHPGHDMRPAESAISKDVVEFLIDHQAHFVFGMSKRMSHATRRSKSAASPSSTTPTPTVTSRSPSENVAMSTTRDEAPFATSPRPPAIPEDREASPQKTETTPLPIPVVAPVPIPSSGPSILSGQPMAHSPEPSASSLPKTGTLPVASHSPAPASAPSTTAPSPAPPPIAPSPVSMAPSAPGSGRTSLTLQRPPPIRADTDCMVPSDSDDDAPPGGYYIVERATSPHRATSPFPPSPEPTGTVTPAMVVLQSILPPRPTRRSRGKSPAGVTSAAQGQFVPAVDVLQPSDSDDDAPAGGYVMFSNRPGTLRTAAMGRAHSAAASPNARPTASAESTLGRSRTVLQSGEGRANSPQPPPQGATGLLRRRTLPTKRVSDFTARMRRVVREA